MHVQTVIVFVLAGDLNTKWRREANEFVGRNAGMSNNEDAVKNKCPNLKNTACI